MQAIGRQSMLELIEDLSPEQQQVLTLKFVFNFANAEVATILGKTEGAMKSLQHRALVSLQKQIAADAELASARGARGRNRRAAELGQDDALRVRSRGAETTAARSTSAWPRSRTSGSSSSPSVVSARKVTPAAVRVVDVPAPGRQLLGNLRQVDALLVVLDGFSGTRVPDRRPRDAEARAARRRPRPRRAAARAGGEAGEVGRHEAARGGRGPRAAARAPRRRAGRWPTGTASSRRSSSRSRRSRSWRS